MGVIEIVKPAGRQPRAKRHEHPAALPLAETPKRLSGALVKRSFGSAQARADGWKPPDFPPAEPDPQIRRFVWSKGRVKGVSTHLGTHYARRLALALTEDAIYRLAELAQLDKRDKKGQLIPLDQIPGVDQRIVTVAVQAILDRGLGKPKTYDDAKDALAERIAAMTPEERTARLEELFEAVAHNLDKKRERETKQAQGVAVNALDEGDSASQ
jgi:hypothetical protein